MFIIVPGCHFLRLNPNEYVFNPNSLDFILMINSVYKGVPCDLSEMSKAPKGRVFILFMDFMV